jgi:hypothetical protein
MDKNKSSYKLKGLPDIYWINMDSDLKRSEYMNNQFNYWEVSNHTRISAYNGKESDLGEYLKGRYPENMSSTEVGCTLSHLKAINYWYNNSDKNVALIMEDDVDFQTVKYWNFNWYEFFSKIPYDWDIIQLAIISTGNIHVKLHKRFVNNFSTAAYLINRHYAEKILKNHVRNDKYKIDQGVKPRAVSDDLIYNSGNTFSIPLFLYKPDLGSSIHPDHVEIFHKNNYEGILNFWINTGYQMNISDLMDYDPYLGRISEPSNNSA